MRAAMALMMVVAACGRIGTNELNVPGDGGIPDAGAIDAGPCSDSAYDFCVGDRNHRCRLNLLGTELAGPCAVDSDCVLIPRIDQMVNCASYGLCEVRPGSVLAANLNEWRSRALEEMQRYCGSNSSCRIATQCSLDAGAVARCSAGTCGSGPP